MKILITGGAGHIGKSLRKAFAGRYPLIRVLDRAPITDLAAGEESLTGDVSDAELVERAVDGVDGVVHLAAVASEAPFEDILRANVIGAWNVYEAARRKGAKRVVFASSNHAVGFYPRSQRIDETVPVKPDTRYGLSKCWGEAVGHLYADKYGVTSLHIRIGTATDLPQNERALATWISPRDLAQLVRIGLEHSGIHSDIVYGVSDNLRAWHINSAAYRLGYKPEDRAEDHVAIAMEGEAKLTHEPADLHFQGGIFCAMEYAGPPPGETK